MKITVKMCFICLFGIASLFLYKTSIDAYAQNYSTHGLKKTSIKSKKEYPHIRLYVDFNWEKRPYLAYVPKRIRKNSVPVFIILHEEGSSPVEIARESGISQLAEKYGFSVVYPKSTSAYWNAGKCCSNLSKEGSKFPDDIGYLKSIIKHFSQYQPINKNKVYVIGYSNGGMMSYRVACEMADEITGIGVIAGNIQIDDCKPKAPIDLIAIHSKDDEQAPYYGGIPGEGIRVKELGSEINDKPIMDTLLFWASNALCPSFPLQTSNAQYSTYFCKGTSSSSNKSKVKLILLEEGGHSWYGGRSQDRQNIFSDRRLSTINASKEIVKFFIDF